MVTLLTQYMLRVDAQRSSGMRLMKSMDYNVKCVRVGRAWAGPAARGYDINVI